MNWEEIKSSNVGDILHDEFEDGLRFIIMRGPASLCAYIGIPLDHPLSNHSYDNLSIYCHGGLTFGSEGGGKWPKDFYWYGWDYAHSGDYSFYDDDFVGTKLSTNGKKWLIEDVLEDSWEAKFDFKKLMKLSEDIKKNNNANV